MLQQINLYQDVLRKEKGAMALLPLGLALLGGLLLLLLLAGLWSWQNSSLRQQLAALQAEQNTLTTRLAKLPTQYPPKEKSKLLEDEVARLERARDARGPLTQLLVQEREQPAREFSAVLESLARQIPAGVWLRGVGIGARGRRVGLAGSTQEPQLVPRFLQQLATEPTLAGMEFDRMQMNRSTVDAGTVDFTLQTPVEVKP